MLATSMLLPTDTNPPIPRPRLSAASSTASPIAPDWLSTDVLPGRGTTRLKVALNLASAIPLSIPVQFGPTSLTPPAWASRSRSAWRAAPSLPVSANPAEMTHTALTPRTPAWATIAGTAEAGTQTMTRSGTTGHEARSGYAAIPCTVECFLFTGSTTPPKWLSTKLPNSRPAIVFGSVLAPTTAMEWGRRNASSAACAALDRSRNTASRYRPVSASAPSRVLIPTRRAMRRTSSETSALVSLMSQIPCAGLSPLQSPAVATGVVGSNGHSEFSSRALVKIDRGRGEARGRDRRAS